MTALRRTLLVLLVVVLLLGAVVAAAEWFVRRQVEALVTDAVVVELDRATEGEGFASVETSLGGSALAGLAGGSFDRLQVDAADGVVRGVPVASLQVVAEDVSLDGREVRRLQGTVRADAADAVASQLGDEAAQATSAVAVPPDRVRVTAPFEVAAAGVVPVDVELLFRVADGGLVVEPVSARAGGTDVDPATLERLRTYGVAADQLPAGLQVRTATVSDVAGRAVLDVGLDCTSGCRLR